MLFVGLASGAVIGGQRVVVDGAEELVEAGGWWLGREEEKRRDLSRTHSSLLLARLVATLAQRSEPLMSGTRACDSSRSAGIV